MILTAQRLRCSPHRFSRARLPGLQKRAEPLSLVFIVPLLRSTCADCRCCGGDGWARRDPGPRRVPVGAALPMRMIDRPSPNHGPRAKGAVVDILLLHYTGMPTAQAAVE